MCCLISIIKILTIGSNVSGEMMRDLDEDSLIEMENRKVYTTSEVFTPGRRGLDPLVERF